MQGTPEENLLNVENVKIYFPVAQRLSTKQTELWCPKLVLKDRFLTVDMLSGEEENAMLLLS